MVTAGYSVSSEPVALVSGSCFTAWDPKQVPVLYDLAQTAIMCLLNFRAA